MALGRPKSEGPTWAKVAAALGISERRLLPWRTHPDAPQEPDVEAWMEFKEKWGVGKGGSQELQRIKVEIATEQLAKIKRENAILEGEMIATKDVREFLQDWTAKLDLLLTAVMETNLPPKLVGRPIAEIRFMLRNAHDEIREATAKGLLKWQPDTPT